jgi:HEAT repeat protein
MERKLMSRKAVFTTIVLSCFGATALAQDYNQSKKEFKQAVVEQNSMSVASLAAQVAGFETRDAVDTLIWGYDYYAQILQTLWRERTQLQLQQETYEDFMIELKRLQAEIDERKRKGQPGDPALNDRITKFNKKMEDYQKVKEQLAQTELKINSVNQIKSSIVAALAKFKSDAAVAELVNDLKRSAGWTTRAAVAEALGQIDHAAALPALRERLIKGESEAGAIVALLDALAKKDQWDEETIRAVALHLESTFWQVRYSAAMALKSSKSPHAIEPLARALERADGRLKHDLHEALVAVTGVDKGMDAAAWKTWFESNREQLLGGGYKPKADEGFKPGGEAKATTVEFYGIPVKSKNVMFVLD